ncbi:MAG: lipase family protein [Mycobacterium sp.]
MRRRIFMAGAVAAAAAVPLATACSKEGGTSQPSGTAPQGGEPGTLLGKERIDTSITGAQAWKVRYASRDANDTPTESSGLVIAPEGRGDNRPILIWCHGTTGLGDAACPSAQPDPARELITYFTPQSTQQIDYGVPGLQGFIDDGWVVCASDYQGLGTPGMHQYLLNRTNARDAVNSAHAARSMDLGAGTTLGCAGWSQGGGAAAAVAELDPSDYLDLRLIGTVTMSPGVSKIAINSKLGPMPALTDNKLTPPSYIVMILAGIQAANPSKLALSDVFTPLGLEILEQAWEIQPTHHLNDTVARLFRLKGPILNSPLKNFDQWKSLIEAGSAANRKPIAPVLVCVDSFDGGTVVPVPWQTDYVNAVKSFGGSVEVRDYPKDDHFALPAACVGGAREWLNGLK